MPDYLFSWGELLVWVAVILVLITGLTDDLT